MRAIKFRFWDEEEKKFYYGDLYDLKYGYLEHDILLPEFPVMQFTGLHDKTGRGIYEKDYLKSKGGDIMLVNWHSKLACFCLDKDGWMYSHFFGEAVDPEETEIIGSIYETNLLTPQTR